MDKTSTITIVTAKEKGAPEVKTVLKINWDGMNEEFYRALATPTLIIKRQGEYRRKGIPASDEILARDNLPGTRHGMTLEQAVTSMSTEQKQALAKQLAEMIAAEAKAAKPEAKKVA
jgi:hypothetical protein